MRVALCLALTSLLSAGCSSSAVGIDTKRNVMVVYFYNG
jgi:hypothetical protein